jgi:branched-chain amino acid transport system ATP-binding protein
MRFVRRAERYESVNRAAGRALAAAGLAGREHALAAALSHGEQRQLEIAMTLATSPRVLLLDEPLAGMGAEESARMVELIRSLKDGHAILLVEHDMDAVFALADRLTVMTNGQVLASGKPAEIRTNRDVQQAYLGEEAAP